MNTNTDDLTVSERLFLPPKTALAWGSLAAAAVFVLCLALLPFASHPGGAPSGRSAGFWDDLPGAFMLIGTAACGIASGVLSLLAIWRRGERFILLFATLLLGAFVLLFTCEESLEGLGRR